jgi:hypothetical protein
MAHVLFGVACIIAAANNLAAGRDARRMVLWVAGLIPLSGFI